MKILKKVLIIYLVFFSAGAHAGRCSFFIKSFFYTLFTERTYKEEDKPISKQQIARDNPNDETLINSWNQRETEVYGLERFHTYGYPEDALRFVLTDLHNWRELTNKELRTWIDLYELSELHQEYLHQKYLEVTNEGPSNEPNQSEELKIIINSIFMDFSKDLLDKIRTWNKRFPNQTIPESPL